MESLCFAQTALPVAAWARAGRRSRQKISMEASVYWSVMTNQNRYFKSFLKQVAVAAVILSGTWAYAQATPDRVAYKLEDPSRPASVRAHLLNGSITVKGSDGNEVIVEARPRGQERAESE